MTDHALIETAVDATVKRIQLQHSLDQELARRAAAVWSLFHNERFTVPQIVNAIREGVRARGYTDEQIDGQGVRRDNIRRMVDVRV